jgi:hypothetical protein
MANFRCRRLGFFQVCVHHPWPLYYHRALSVDSDNISVAMTYFLYRKRVSEAKDILLADDVKSACEVCRT